MVRMTVTEPNAAVAGVMFTASFPIFMASMATFSKDRTLARRFDRGAAESMAKTRGSCGETGGVEPVGEDSNPNSLGMSGNHRSAWAAVENSTRRCETKLLDWVH